MSNRYKSEELALLQTEWQKRLRLLAKNLIYIYKSKKVEVIALDKVNLRIFEGEFIAIMGPSGSGKSTLIKSLVGLVQPNAGSIYVDLENKIQDLTNMEYDELSLYRLKYLGYIPQHFSLFEELDVKESILLQRLLLYENEKKAISKEIMAEWNKKAEELITFVNLTHRRHHKISDLSGGEQQRVAIASALFKNPLMIFADEPTGELDSKNTILVFELFQKITKEQKIPIICVTHNDLVKDFATRIVKITDGKIND